jgi:nucleotide-binding universal stress UspA family protein
VQRKSNLTEGGAVADKIVVGYDGSEHAKRALATAIDWAKKSPDGEVIITCSQDRPAPGIGFRGLDMGVEEMYEKLVKRIEAELAEAAAVCEKAGVRSASVCTADAPEEGMVKVAKDSGASMIVVGVKGIGAKEGQRTHLGSTTSKLLNEAGGTVPILVV